MSDLDAALGRTRIGDRATAQHETERAVRRGAWPVTEAPVGKTTGWWGMVLFIATEAAMFACFIASYYYLRFSGDGSWPPASDKLPHWLVPGIGTGILVLSCVPMFVAVRTSRRSRAVTFPLLVLVTLAGTAFVVLQAIDYMEEYPSSTPSKDAYGSLLFTLTGLHAFHVGIGVLMMLLVLGGQLVRGVRKPQAGATRVMALYWYFLAVLAVVIYFTVYLSPYVM
ncbi:MAG TPA: heme-copper oxidase subunit III [Marmoricola sp.]|nr:heme-copper oxidase subunit III [Marmoricola sp.]